MPSVYRAFYDASESEREASMQMQGMARKIHGKPYFAEIRKVAVNFLPPSGASDQYLQNTPALTLQREKPGTRREGITLNMPIRYAGCHE